MFNVFSLLLHNTFKTAAPLFVAAVNEVLRQTGPLLDNSQLQLVDGSKASPAIDQQLKGTPNTGIHWVQVWAVWGPHVWFNECDVLPLCNGAFVFFGDTVKLLPKQHPGF
jgi:hypothetical protein